MKLDLNIGYWGVAVGRDPTLALEAERLGYRCIWTAEAYGSDAATVLASIAAQTTTLEIGAGIFQMPARTPAMTAMTAATLDDLSGGRFRLGLGLSGPQVVEGWHGVPYGRPLTRTREYVEIVRRILARQERVAFDGKEYQIPYAGEGATGLGKPLKLMGVPHPDIPIYLASIGPKNVELTAEIADGWLPVFYSPERAPEVFGAAIDAGLAKGGREHFDVVPTVQAHVSDDVAHARDHVKPMLALYVGGMGARGRNFYHDLACRYGYEDAANRIQDLYLDGRKEEAIAAVPDALVDEVALVGPAAAIRERLEVWRESRATALAVASMDLHTLRTVAELAL
ncbi:MAG: LLM class F420-dependent oxidoreductase [Acidimicrobiia bacterium]|nr:LLM class F420-dependent oxidoreductase [Acidimicrobiia bacterium]